MARNDIRIFREVEGGIGVLPLAGSQTFLEGEVVVFTAGGLLQEASTNPGTVTGISAAPSFGMNATGEAGHLSDSSGNDTTVRPTGTLIQFYKPASGQLFSCSNFATDGSGTAAAIPVTVVGDTAGFTLTSGNWFVDTGVTNTLIEITHVLDSNGAPLGDSTIRTVGTGVAVVFGFL
jgi:hypothetical protein